MNVAKTWVALITTSILALPAFGQLTQTEIQELAGHNGDNSYGPTVAVDGRTAVLGARLEGSSDLELSGAAYVYVRSGGVWTRQAKLLASDRASEDQFGNSVAIQGDTIVIGAPYKTHDGTDEVGAAYVFVRSGDTWAQQSKLLPADKTWRDRFGRSVAVDGDTVVIGSSDNVLVDQDPGDPGVLGANPIGAAYIFTRSGNTWNQQTKLVASDREEGRDFGKSVAIDGDTVLVGDTFGSDSYREHDGAAYVFIRSGDTWMQQAKLMASDQDDGFDGEWFGWSVALDGDTAIIGAPNEISSLSLGIGSAYVFTRAGNDWAERSKLVSFDIFGSISFGNSVAIDGDTAVVGDSAAPLSSAYVYARTENVWTQYVRLRCSSCPPDTSFGTSVAIDGNTAIVGDWNDAFVFDTVDNGLGFVRSLGDINDDGRQDIVALTRKSGTPTAIVKDAILRNRLSVFKFDEHLVPVDLEIMPDINGNGAPELVLLDASSTRSEVRDSLSGESLGHVDFDPYLTPLDLELVTDQTANGVPELAMLGQTPIKVEVKDPINQRTVNSFKFNQNYVPKDLSVWSRGTNVSVAMLAESKDATRSDKVEIRDLDTGQIVKHIWVGKAWNLLQMEQVADLNGNGAPELAILREHPEDNWVSVQPMDTASGSRFRSLGFDPNYRPVRLRVLDDINGNGYEEIAVLAVRRGCCNQKVWVKDTKTGQSIQRVFFGKQHIGIDMDISPDINGNGTPELVVLGQRDDGVLRAIIKDSKTGEFISSVGF